MSGIQRKSSQYRAVIAALIGIALGVFAGDVLAADTISDVASRITGTFAGITKLITATAYLAGMGFAVGAIIKFKAHKDNPAQVPIGQPVGLLVVAVSLLFLPYILGVTGESMFGSTSTSGPKGVTF